MFGASGDHHFIEDQDSGIVGEDLTLLLFAHIHDHGEAGVNASVEFGHVVVQVRLADLGLRGKDMLDECGEVNAIESFCWIVKDGVVDVVDGGGKLVASDG